MPAYTPSTASSEQEPKMEVVYFSNEFPRDDLQGLLRKLHAHSKDRRHTVLAQFFAEATRSVKEEIRELPKHLRSCFKPFSTIIQWAEDTELREGPLNGAVDGVLLSVVQLATYIGYAEEHPDELFNFGNTCLTGLGLGLISSTAIALSPTVAELPLAGADAVRLAFRMGVLVTDISADLEARVEGESPDSWAYVVHNVEPDEAQHQLDLFNFKEKLPETGKVSLSALSRTSVTVSAPPARLKELFKKSQYYRDARSIALPVYGGLCHAPHIYNRSHAQRIVREANLNCNESKRLLPMIPVYSTSTGKPFPARNALDLLEDVILEPLTQPIVWDEVVSGIVDRATATCAQNCTIYNYGPSIPLKELNDSLSARITEFQASSLNIMSWIGECNPDELNSRGPAQAKLAIVGMSCRLPGGATNTEKFWEILEQGLDVSRKIPADRFDIETHYDPTGKQLNKSMTQYMCAIDEPGLFDAGFFNMSPREAQVVDPQMRLALVTAYEALERAGYVANRTASTLLQRIGTWYGQSADDYREVNQGQEVSTYYIPGGCRAFGAGRINYYFKFAGPSYSVDTACSSGLAAIEVACQALWNGEVDTAVTGGVNILTNPDGFAGLNCGHFLTKTHNACKTWDATADGYCRADGIGSLVIKRLEDAEADNDNILGVILGAGTNHSAEAVSITHPHAGHQAYLARQVLRQAGVDPLDVSYVELHGTGTQAGDHEEMQGIMDVYAPLSGRRNKNQPLYIGASKANVGHGESVAGTTALIKTLLMLQKDAIPRHVGIKTEINPRFPKDFDKRNLHIAMEQTTWPKHPGKKRIAAINNFGAAGGNTTMVIEEAPARLLASSDSRPIHVVNVSAKNKKSLAGNIERLQAWIEKHPEVSLADLSYTTTARRQHYNHRVAIAATDIKGLQKELAKKLAGAESHAPIPNSGAPPVAFCFTGQGAAHKSMNLELYRDVPTFRSDFNHLDSLAQRQGFPSIIPAVDGSFPQDHAHSPVVTQLSQVCAQMALSKYWSTLGVKPDMVLGHSLGEYAAMYVAGVLSANDTIYLVGKRAQLLEQKARVGSHQMMAVRASLAQIQAADGGKKYEVACINGPQDTVLSGTVTQMDAVSEPLTSAGYRCIKLDVAFAFHSEQMDPILEEFEEIAKTGVLFKEPVVPVISPLHGKVIFDGKTLNAKYCRDATRGTVNFLAALESAQEISTITEDTVYVEIGAHPVCCGFVKSTIPLLSLAVPSFRRGESNWATIAQACAGLHLAGLDIDWNSYHKPMEKCLTLLDLPTYAFNEKTYWLQYNGDWCLTKGNNFYTAEKEAEIAAKYAGSVKSNSASPIKTSTVQNIIEEHFQDFAGTVVMESDLMQTDFLAAAHGHKMNGCGVVTSSIHADIAYTLGEYFFKKLNKKAKKVDMNVANLYVSKGLVANADTSKPQCIRVTLSTDDIRTDVANLYWQNVDSNGNAADVFAEAKLIFGDSAQWLSCWGPITHLVQGRIDALDQMAREGKATRLSHNMAYTLFGKNLVDYHHKYRGMQAVTMNELEAYADVELTKEKGGVWTVPPYFIDSVAHLAGFVMNCSDAIDTVSNYCVTPGWNSMQFAKPLTPGAKYCSYVKMIPTTEDPTVYFGDVYILQDGVIVGMVGGIQFRRFPRILLNKFFSPPDKSEPISANKSSVPAVPKPAPAPIAAPVPVVKATPVVPPAPVMERHDSGTGVEPTEIKKETTPAAAPAPAPAADASMDTSSVTYKALELIANEAALEMSDLEDDVSFAALGIDSLMSLVISEKFRSELDIKVGGSMFLDYPTIGDLKAYTDTL